MLALIDRTRIGDGGIAISVAGVVWLDKTEKSAKVYAYTS